MNKNENVKHNFVKNLKYIFLTMIIIFLSQVLIIWTKINLPLLGNIIGLMFVVGFAISIYFCYCKSLKVSSDTNLIISNIFLILFLSIGLLSSALITTVNFINVKDFTSTKVKYPIETVTKTKEGGQKVFKITYIKNETPHTVTISEEKLPDFTISRGGKNYLEVETFSPLKQEQECNCSETVPGERYKIVGEKKIVKI